MRKKHIIIVVFSICLSSCATIDWVGDGYDVGGPLEVAARTVFSPVKLTGEVLQLNKFSQSDLERIGKSGAAAYGIKKGANPQAMMDWANE